MEHKSGVLPNVFCLMGTPGCGYRSFSYVVELDSFSVLIDVSDEKFIRDLATFKTPRHLILTHRHTRLHEAEFEKKFGLSVWLHPADANAPRKGFASTTAPASKYYDPTSQGLDALALQFTHVPGHTPGSGFYFLKRHGGVLFVGDAVTGPKVGENPCLHVPPSATSDNDAELHQSLRQFVPPVHASILPLHGEPLRFAHADDAKKTWDDLRASL